jgi:hypothetical protein
MNIDLAMNIREEKIRRFPNSLVAKQEKFTKENPGLIEALKEMPSWHTFASSLVSQFNTRGSLTDNQVGAAVATLMKHAQKEEQKSKEVKSSLVSVDYSKVKEVLDNAFADKIKTPKLRFDGIVLSRAGDNSKNPGAVYVKVDGFYAGKLHGGYFTPFNAPEGTTEKLISICKDPLTEAVAYGKKFGSCCACGRTLTNHASIEAGIGPICGSRF